MKRIYPTSLWTSIFQLQQPHIFHLLHIMYAYRICIKTYLVSRGLVGIVVLHLRIFIVTTIDKPVSVFYTTSTVSTYHILQIYLASVLIQLCVMKIETHQLKIRLLYYFYSKKNAVWLYILARCKTRFRFFINFLEFANIPKIWQVL